MAIENAKTLNVRIRNKYDSYEAWAASSLVLEAGEIAIAYTTVNVDIGNGKIEQHPELLMKVGNGTDTFTNLPWLSAKAADVAAWAKAADKPSYSASEITGMEQYIADYVETEMGISVDTDTQYQIVKVDDYNYKLQSKGKSDDAWADVADSVIVIPNDTAAIEALQGLVGDTKVATQITNAIAALDLTNTYEAKGEAAKVQTALDEYKETNDAAVDANTDAIAAIKDGTDIDSFADVETALAGKQAAGDYATKTEAQGYADAKDEAIAAAKQAGDDAQADVDALAAKVGEVAEGKTVVDMIADAQVAATYDDTALAGRVSELETLVGDEAVASQISTAVAAEAEIARAAEKANADAIGVLNGNSSVEGSVDKKVADAINTFATQISDDDTVNTYRELINYAASHGSEFTELVGEVDTNTKAIETLNGGADVAGSVDKKIADAIAAENLAQYATDTELAGVDSRLQAVEGAVGETGSVSTAIADALAEAKRYTDDEVKELADGAVATNAGAIAALEVLVGDTEVATQITNAIDTALKVDGVDKYALASALTAAIEQHNTDKTALEEAIELKANDADLATVAKSGLIDDLSIGQGTVLVFDCGNSSEV